MISFRGLAIAFSTPLLTTIVPPGVTLGICQIWCSMPVALSHIRTSWTVLLAIKIVCRRITACRLLCGFRRQLTHQSGCFRHYRPDDIGRGADAKPQACYQHRYFFISRHQRCLYHGRQHARLVCIPRRCNRRFPISCSHLERLHGRQQQLAAILRLSSDYAGIVGVCAS